MRMPKCEAGDENERATWRRKSGRDEEASEMEEVDSPKSEAKVERFPMLNAEKC